MFGASSVPVAPPYFGLEFWSHAGGIHTWRAAVGRFCGPRCGREHFALLDLVRGKTMVEFVDHFSLDERSWLKILFC